MDAMLTILSVLVERRNFEQMTIADLELPGEITMESLLSRYLLKKQSDVDLDCFDKGDQHFQSIIGEDSSAHARWKSNSVFLTIYTK